MTCIVGIVDKEYETVYLAADRGTSDGGIIQAMMSPKIVKNGPYVIGYAGYPGPGQLMQVSTLPTPPKRNLNKFMRTTFVNSVKKMMIDNSLDFRQDDADMLIGVSDSLFFYSPLDHQIVEYEYTSIGSGAEIAMGSLYTTQTWKSSEKRAYTAVAAAVALSPSCCGPIDIIYT